MSIWSFTQSSHRLFNNLLVQSLKIFSLAIYVLLSGCHSSGDAHSDIDLHWKIDPDPPSVGMATINITLTDSTEQILTGAEIELEGNMSHPGMQPVFATADEISPGQYSATIEFTMGGEWFLLIHSTLADERVVKKQINIPRVRSQ